MPDWGFFCIASATGQYWFDEEKRVDAADDDLRHVVPVAVAKIIAHRANTDAQTIATSFRAYQRAVNIINRPATREAVERLMASEIPGAELSQSAATLFQSMGEELAKRLNEELMARLRVLQPGVFESVVRTMIERGGYRILKTNHHDGAGGDADIVAEPIMPPLAEAFEHRAPLLIQIKKKEGIDGNDVEAVNQLVRMSQTYPDATMVVMSTADRFTEGCEIAAKTAGVQLISQRTLARLLIKYML
jgi:restriction endonuclease Mrr